MPWGNSRTSFGQDGGRGRLMATRSFVGAAKKVAQISTVTPGGTIAATDTFVLTINNKSITFTVGGTATVAAVVTGLYDLFIASTEPEFLEIEATDSTTHLTLTARIPGVPFTFATVANNVSGGGAPSSTDATPTAASGPTFANVAANWSGATLPVDSDIIVIEGAHNITDGLDQSAVSPERIIIRDFSGTIGRPPINPAGYPEYREQYMKYGATADGVTIDVDVFQGTTSGLIRLNTNDAQTVLNVYQTGNPASPLIKALTFQGTHASNVANVLAGSVGFATEAGESATLATLRVGPGNFGSALDVECGIGLTCTTFNFLGGTAAVYNDIGTINAKGGTAILTLWDDADITTALSVLDGATVYPNGVMTVAASTIANGGQILLNQDNRAVTFSATITVGVGGVFRDPFGRGTYSGSPDFQWGTGANSENTTIVLASGLGFNVA